jgi:hypothetical protein
MTTTRVDVLTLSERDRLRAELERQVQEYKDSGGVVTVCPPRAFSEADPDAPKRKFDRLMRPDSLTDPTNRDIGAHRPAHKKGEEA